MEHITIVSNDYNMQHNNENILSMPMNIIISDEGCTENTPNIIRNFIVKHLDDNNIELISCDTQDLQLNESTAPESVSFQNISDIHLETETSRTKVIRANALNPTIGSRGIPNKCNEVPVIRTNQQDTVIQHSSASVLKPTSASTAPIREMPPLWPKPERISVDVTVYSCFKCSEQFNNLTLFRQHLKWHKPEKDFNCSKCLAGFNAENNLKIHMVTSHPGNSDVCPICEIRFQRKASLRSHVMIHQVDEIFLCDGCHGEFQNDEELLKHMESHSVTKVTKTLSDSKVCPYCKLNFQSHADYKQHVAKHAEVRKNVLKGKKVRKSRFKEKGGRGGYKCQYCTKVFPKSSLMDRHERIHTGEKPYKCEFCSRAFSQKGTLQIHLDKHTGLKPYPCTLCPAKFSQKGNLRAHVEKTHTAPKGGHKMYRCTQCTCIFRKIATLNGHMTKVHLNQSDETDQRNIIDKVMDSLKELHSELGKSALKQEEPKRTPSPPANRGGTTVVKLAENHANGGVRRYTVRQKKIGDVRWYFCSYCSSRFKKPSDLIRHFRTHTLEKPFRCSTCNQAFSLKSTLVNHYKTHEKSDCECEYCDISFRNSRNFLAHVRNHKTKNSPSYVCYLCEKVFWTLEEGKEHMATHEAEIQCGQNVIEPLVRQPLYNTTHGTVPLKPPKAKVPNTGAESTLERPHHCKICDARFNRLMSLKRHMMHHSGERKFKCNLCPKTFVTKYGLKEHLNFHKNIKNFGCQTCGKKFVTSSLLKRHALIHSRVTPYQCPYCDKLFKTVLLCRSHIRNLHKLTMDEVEKEKMSIVAEKIASVVAENTAVDVETANSASGGKEDPKSEKGLPRIANTNRQPPEPVPPEKQQENLILSVTPQHSSEEPAEPEYQMVYLNLADLPVTNSDAILNGNNLMSSIKLNNDLYLFNPLNDLQDSGVLFNIEDDKLDMVDLKKVRDSSSAVVPSSDTCHPSEISTVSEKFADPASSQQDHQCVRPGGDVAKSLKNDQSEISFREMSTDDLGALPISVIDTADSNALATSLINGEIIPYDAPVICINCHKMFPGYHVFEKHACLEESTTAQAPQDNLKLLLQDGADDNDDIRIRSSDVVDGKVYATTELATNCDQKVQPAAAKKRTDQGTISESYENNILEISCQPKSSMDLEKMKRHTYKKRLLVDVDDLEQPKQFSCIHCHFVTSFEESFRKHLLFHPDFGDRICKYCFKDFKKPSDLKRHVRTHTGEKPFECGTCHKKFALKSTLHSHQRTHDMESSERVTCDVCNARFSFKSSLKVHMLLHTGVRPHACTFCEQTFRTSAIRKAHEKSTHLSKVGPGAMAKPKLEGTKLVQSIAEEVAKNVSKQTNADQNNSLKSQFSKVPTQTAILVNSGETDLVALDSVFLLQQLQNSGIIIAPGSDGSLPINLADYTLLDVNDFQTEEIGRESFDGTATLDGKNLSYATEAKPQRVECDICHKLYASKDVLRKHKRALHGQNKKFPCIKCDKGYDQLEELNKHIAKLHTGSRPYACQYCANSFSEENSLRTHIKRIHQKSMVGQETTNALLGLQYDLSTEDHFV